MIRRLKAALRRSEADRLAVSLDAQRAEQHNAEALLRRLHGTRERALEAAHDDTDGRLDEHDTEIAEATGRAARALRRQADLMRRLEATSPPAEPR